MEKRILGNSGISVSPIGLGCLSLLSQQTENNEENMVELIHHAIASGCNFFDTAFFYGEENEKLLGRAIAPFRDKVVIATKGGVLGRQENGELIRDSSFESIKAQAEESRKRLGVDFIDLYYIHRIDPDTEPEETARAMKELITEGKIKAWGVSHASTDYIRRAHAVCPITAMQYQYSMIHREPEAELFALCEELKIAFVAYSPLGNGFLSGKYTKEADFSADFRRRMPQFSIELVDKNQPLLDVLHKIADAKNATSAQIVLAWELAQKPYIIAIPGTTKLHRLEENLGAMDITLTPTELSEIDKVLNEL